MEKQKYREYKAKRIRATSQSKKSNNNKGSEDQYVSTQNY